MFHLLFKQFIRAKSTLTALILLLLAGIISMATGKQQVQKQRANISHIATLQKEHIERNVKYYNSEVRVADVLCSVCTGK